MSIQNNKLNKSQIAYLILGFFILIGGFFRLYALGFQSLWIDEVFTTNASLSVLSHGVPLLDSGQFYINNFVSVYLTAFMIKIFGLNALDPWALRLPAVLFGSGLIWATYFLSKKLFNSRNAALLAAFVITFLYQEIAWSRQVRGYAALALFVVIAVYFLWKYLGVERNKRDLNFFIGFCILACLSHWVALAFIPAFFLIYFCRKTLEAFNIDNKSYIFLSILIICPIFIIVVSLPDRGLIFRYIIFPFLPFFVIILCQILNKMARINKLLPWLVIVIICYPILLFYPQVSYKLDLVAPQPDFGRVFSIIRTRIQPGDIVISPYPSLQKVYLGDAGRWLEITTVQSDKEFYTGALPIKTTAELIDITNTKHGFIILHRHAIDEASGLPTGGSRIQYITHSSNIKKLYYEAGSSENESIWLYTF